MKFESVFQRGYQFLNVVQNLEDGDCSNLGRFGYKESLVGEKGFDGQEDVTIHSEGE